MSHFDKELKSYAESGLRTAEDWKTLGREVIDETKPRSSAQGRGSSVDLFSRDQTQRRERSPRG